MSSEWELSGSKHYVSLAAAQRTATWLSSIARLKAWEFSAATLDDGSHRVLRGRLDGRTAGGAIAPPDGRTAERRLSRLARLRRSNAA